MVALRRGAIGWTQEYNDKRRLSPEARAARDTRELQQKRDRERHRRRRVLAKDPDYEKRKVCPGCGTALIRKHSKHCRSCDSSAHRMMLPQEELERQLTTPYREGMNHDFEWRVRLLEITQKDVPL